MDARKPIGQQLIDLGLITEEQLDAALNLQKKRRDRLGELLLSLRFISEVDILKVLAERLQVHYLSSEKLASAKIPQSTLDFIPKDFAERRLVLPIQFDAERKTLSFLANQPNDTKLLKEVQLLAQVREVNAYLAMKPALSAGIAKFYRGDERGFEQLMEASLGPSPLLALSGEGGNAALSGESAPPPGGLRLADEVAAGSLLSDNVFIETLNILVSLLELKNGAFRGHSASVARLVKRVSEKLELKPKDVYFNVVAAYFHALGMKEGLHQTLINLTTEQELKLAQKYYLAPVRLIATARFPRIVPDILTHLFERVDGKGFPDGLAGENIPLGSRIIAAVDAYEDLVRNPAWSEKPLQEIFKELFNYQGTCFDRKVLRALYETVQEGQGVTGIESTGPTLLLVDPTGSSYTPQIARLKEAGFRLLVSRDTDTATQILKQNKVELILCDLMSQPLNAYQLCRAIKGNAATRSLTFVILSTNEEPSKTVQTAFDAGADDFFSRPLKSELIVAKLRRHVERRRETFTGMQAQTTPTRASVTGSLSDIPLADILQLLANGRKTGMLVLRDGEREAKVFIESGSVVNCFHGGLDGYEAFWGILEWEKGEFALETDCTMPERKISMPVENLLLEGFRRLDERRAGRR